MRVSGRRRRGRYIWRRERQSEETEESIDQLQPRSRSLDGEEKGPNIREDDKVERIFVWRVEIGHSSWEGERFLGMLLCVKPAGIGVGRRWRKTIRRRCRQNVDGKPGRMGCCPSQRTWLPEARNLRVPKVLKLFEYATEPRLAVKGRRRLPQVAGLEEGSES